jgi:predicted dehydrogenase
MSDPGLRAAVIGYGLAGRVFHTSLLAADPTFTIDAIVTANPERAGEAAARFPDARILSTVDDLFAEPGRLDLIVVAAPTPEHARLARRAIEAGIAVVVDKPLAVHSQEAEELIGFAEARGVPLTVFHNRRWDGDFLTVGDLVTTGRLGQVWRFESRFEWLNPRPRPAWKSATAGSEGGGVAYDLGSHLIDQAVHLFGPVADYYGEFVRHRTDTSNDDDSFIALHHESGVRSHLWMSSLVAQRGPRFRVLGSEGAYVVQGLDPQESQLAAGTTPADPDFGSDDRVGRLGTDASFETVPTLGGRYAEFYARLALALRDGAPVPVPPRDALAGLRIIEDLHRRS